MACIFADIVLGKLRRKLDLKNTVKIKMAQDIVSDALNMIRNAKKAGKDTVKINRISNLLIEVLKIMKQKGTERSE